MLVVEPLSRAVSPRTTELGLFPLRRRGIPVLGLSEATLGLRAAIPRRIPFRPHRAHPAHSLMARDLPRCLPQSHLNAWICSVAFRTSSPFKTQIGPYTVWRANGWTR